MASHRFLRSLRVPVFALLCLSAVSFLQAQGAKLTVPQNPIPDADADHIQERNEWFFRGRLVRGKSSAELRRRAYQNKVRMRARSNTALAAPHTTGPAGLSSGSWMPLGPMPLASDATGNGTQDYHQVSGRATAIAIDPADTSGNTIYIGGAQSGVWKSTNAANNTANDVTWTAVTDDQATLSIGAIAIQPGNADAAKTVILAATGEANNSGDSYFGLGILRSADAGSTWNLVTTANGGTLSFSGLGGTRIAFSTASGKMNTVVAAMATTSEGIVDGAVTVNTTRGLYTSLDAGQTWTYDALLDSGISTDATSATSVVYNAVAGKFFAAVRYHGFYSSPDGVTWTRLANQPGGALLSAAACPPQSTSNNYACPLYRAEITVVPNRNEMYAWYVSVDSSGNVVDRGGRASMGACRHGNRSPIAPSQAVATRTAAAFNKVLTISNYWRFRMQPQRICTPERSMSISATSQHRTRLARRRHSSTSPMLMDATRSGSRRTCIRISTRLPTRSPLPGRIRVMRCYISPTTGGFTAR